MLRTSSARTDSPLFELLILTILTVVMIAMMLPVVSHIGHETVAKKINAKVHHHSTALQRGSNPTRIAQM